MKLTPGQQRQIDAYHEGHALPQYTPQPMTTSDQARFLERLRPGDTISFKASGWWTPAEMVSYCNDILTLSTTQGTIHLDMWAGLKPVVSHPPYGITLEEGGWNRIGPPF